MKSYTSHSLEETQEIARNWLRNIEVRPPYSSDEAFVVGLSGHLGAGKTAFVKTVAKILGVEEEITSPTFVIMKVYEITHPKWRRLVHIDAYRLEKREELEALRWESLVADPSNLIMMEWPENVGITEFAAQAHLRFEIVEGVHQISVK
jgi:tRNA threonylcarbamoyladenosine biosynthesis protein TsaE